MKKFFAIVAAYVAAIAAAAFLGGGHAAALVAAAPFVGVAIILGLAVAGAPEFLLINGMRKGAEALNRDNR